MAGENAKQIENMKKSMETKPKYSATPQQTVIVEVSPEEYQADLRRGLAEDETLAPGRHVFRRGAFLKRHSNANAANTTVNVNAPKVRISINLDTDVLEFFKLRASTPNAAPYQTQINNALRAFMESEQNKTSAVSVTFMQSLLADSDFINAVARRVAEQQAEYKVE